MCLKVMNSISFPIKVLLISAVISLLPVAVGVSPLDYKESSIEAADEKKEKKKRRRTKLPSKKAKKILKWKPKISLNQMIKEMVERDLELAKKELS